MARSHPQLHARTRAARRALRSTTRSRTDSSSTRAVPMPIDSGSSRRVHCVRRSLGPSGSATRAPTRTQHCTFERGRSTAPTGLHSSLVPAHSAELDRLGRLLVRSPSEPCPRAVACDALPPAGCMPVVKHSGTDLLASRTPCQLARSRGALCLRAQHERGAGRLQLHREQWSRAGISCRQMRHPCFCDGARPRRRRHHGRHRDETRMPCSRRATQRPSLQHRGLQLGQTDAHGRRAAAPADGGGMLAA